MSQSVSPDDWIVRVGLVSAGVLLSITLLAYWLIYISRIKSDEEDEFENDNLDGIQTAVSPIAIHTSTHSALWKKAAHNNVSPQKKSASVDTKERGRFEILGEDDSDEEVIHPHNEARSGERSKSSDETNDER